MSTKLAFIGAGGIAQWQHFDNLENIENVEITAVCDINEETARDAANPYDAAIFTDYHDLYEEADIDSVFICLPPFAHENQEIMAAERGIDLFVEKPLALSNSKAREILDAITDNDIIAQVGYNWRYSRGIERAVELLKGREIGYIEGYWWGGVPGGEDHWWRHSDRSGGQTVEQATHVFDAIRYLAGDIERVSAAGANRISELVDFSDVISATMNHKNGIISHVSTSCVVEEGRSGIQIIAENAILEISQNHLVGTIDGEEINEEYDRNPYLTEVKTFLNAVRTRDIASLRAPYADAVKSLAVTLAVNQSIKEGEPIELQN